MPVAFPESRVMEIWQGSIQARTDLFTEGNEPVKIVYPGRPNDDRGADLRDAVIATGQGLLRGDIEIHVKSSSWWAHRHHEDPAYNRAILHVVYLHDAGKDTILQNGVEVPTLALHSYFEKSAERRGCPAIAPPTPCRSTCRQANPLLAGKILDEAGDERFFSRMTFFRQETAKSGSGEALYQGTMPALGY